MMSNTDPSAQRFQDMPLELPPTSPPPSSAVETPPIGETPPQELAHQAADGHRGAAWRFMIWILKNDPRAVVAVSSMDDDRLAEHLLEFIALGTWAQKPFVVPLPLRSAYTRTRLRTLFMPGAGMDSDRAQRVLLAGLHDYRPLMRANAAYILGQVGKRSVVPDLIAALRDPITAVRMQAAKALGYTGDPEAVAPLLGAFPRADEHMGSLIFHSLVQLGSVAVPGIIEASTHNSAWIRWYCIRALGEINDERALPTLAQALNDTDHGVAWMAAKNLPPFGPRCVKPILQALMAKEPSPWLAETAGYVFHQLYQRYGRLKPYLSPLVEELNSTTFHRMTGLLAWQTLEKLEADHILSLTLQELAHES
ncbi:HEAT repeat domain-containing protein [Dictyobacter arantiisoli]|uniref:HEAT repeat domain-containing protein n=1 Tax=Dictyobacter arantiisoli TaxID=2014874 RepID=A0A5A5TA28_9CHLR|nr:HEAT repeat domain-containing protein [Dictyobacter arantiisoli]GCF08115.1 hypothetical protein KDI_16790 [Dictyobacter arantiisoli]